MDLYLLRHAKAEPWASTDAGRPLSPAGQLQAQRVGEWCAAQGIAPEALLASPTLRARQTAHAVADALGIGGAGVITAPFLAPGMSPDAAYEGLRDYARFDPVLCVGHEPDLSQLAARLLGLVSGSAVTFTPATLAGFQLASLRGGGARLHALVPGPVG